MIVLGGGQFGFINKISGAPPRLSRDVFPDRLTTNPSMDPDPALDVRDYATLSPVLDEYALFVVNTRGQWQK